ncbi:MAG TPA: SRPBCC family protein [Thermoleophilaceae bacterium]|nr:SRPBCC family protein [Thermoleophilaceae bacterium]
MRQVTVHTVISAPREQIFDFVADLSLRPAYCDHYLRDYRLARVDPRGLGAAARFRLDGPFAKEWAEIEIKACDRPKRIVEEGRVGRLGRSRLVAVYDFIPEAAGTTRVELTTFSEPKTLIDRIKQTGAAGWIRRRSSKALRRLRDIFETGQTGELPRATIAGNDPGKAPRYGDHVPSQHGVSVADR